MAREFLPRRSLINPFHKLLALEFQHKEDFCSTPDSPSHNQLKIHLGH